MMRRLLPLLLPPLLATLCGTAVAADLPAHPFVSTGGKAQMWVAPDIALLQFDTGAQHADAAQAAAALDETSAAIATLLEQAGVAAVDIDGSEVARKNVALSHAAADGSMSAALLSRHYTVQVRDLARLPELVAALLAQDHVDSLSASFDRTDRAAIDRDLMAQAAADARANGTLLAQAFGGRLGPAVAISRAPLEKLAPALLEPPGTGIPALPAGQPIHAHLVPPAIPFAQSVNAVFRLREDAPSGGATTTRKRAH